MSPKVLTKPRISIIVFILTGQYKYLQIGSVALKNNKKISKKELIMETAKNIFSQKGYDDASMDEIALTAGVPKSLIYYHFKNKEELLQEVINKFFIEYELLLKDGNEVGTVKYLRFLDDNSDFLRVILIESIKKTNSFTSIFKVIELLMQYESKISGDKNLADYSLTHERWVVEFFTSIIPGILFACYKDIWCNYFHTDQTTLQRDFLSAYCQTHGEYHKNMQKNENV